LYGFCCFPFRKFLIILSFPDNEPHQVVFHTMIFDSEERLKHYTCNARRQVVCMKSRPVQLGRH
jgi:hypothetical protein